MQIRTALLGTLVLVLVAGNSINAEPIPRSDSEHKFTKREPKTVHNHYHGGGGGGGGGGGLFGGGHGMGSTILGGAALAGGAAFAGTAGNIAAHRLFDDRSEGRSGGGGGGGGGEGGEGGGGGGGGGRSAYPQTIPDYAPARPVAILMSDGTKASIPDSWLQMLAGGQPATAPQYTPQYTPQYAPQYTSQYPPQGSGKFVFPGQK